jgi:hypothetical protein
MYRKLRCELARKVVKGFLEKEVSQKGFAMSSDSQNPIKKKNLLDQMETINPLNHYYNIYCLGRLSENINKVRIAVLLFLKIKLHNGAE